VSAPVSLPLFWKKAGGALGLLLISVGCLSLLEMVMVSVNFGPDGPPIGYVVMEWGMLVSSVVAIWIGKRLAVWGAQTVEGD